MRNWSSIILDIENYLLANQNHISLKYFDSSDKSDLFSGDAGQFIKHTYLNSSNDRKEYFEELNNTLFNVTQVLEEIGFGELVDSKFW
jgi:hypothetical protein